MIVEIANRYCVCHAVALRRIVVTLPSRYEHQVPEGAVFLASPPTAHAAAIARLCRAIDPGTDSDAVVVGDKGLFDRYGARFFEIPYHNAQLAIKIEAYKEPAATTVFEAFPRAAPSPPAPLTGFEFPRR